MSPIDYASPALGPVRARVTERIGDLTRKVISEHTPLEKVPGYRGEIAALTWLLDQLAPPKEVIT